MIKAEENKLNHFLIKEDLDLNNIYNKPFYLIRNGIFNQIEREMLNAGIHNYFISSKNNLNQMYLNCFFNDKVDDNTSNSFEINLKESDFSPWKLLSELNNKIISDFNLLISLKTFKVIKKTKKKCVIGEKEKIILKNESSTKIHPGVIFDTINGPIIIDENVEIYPFSTLEGPLYIGKNTFIKSARISGGVVIGENCKISGEVTNSIIGDYTNKSHEGALLNSYVGSWCNISGYTNTANLKLNYTDIILNNGVTKFRTCNLKLGSIINDYVRLAGGLTMMPGTFVDSCSTLTEGSIIKGYSAPFSYINNSQKYELNIFLSEISKMKQRRNITMDVHLKNYLNMLFLDNVNNDK
jgi:glucose-1-phosphate thymidylyltransferase